MDRKCRDKSGLIIRPGCKRKKMATGVSGIRFKYQSLRCIILLFKKWKYAHPNFSIGYIGSLSPQSTSKVKIICN